MQSIGYNSNNFSFLDVYLDEKEPSVKIHLRNTYLRYPSATVAYDEWPLSLSLWREFYNSHGKYKPELNEYFHMYQCQLNFALVCCYKCTWYFLATSQSSKSTCTQCL